MYDVVDCRDWWDQCSKWAADGRCTTQPLLMAINCARTCNFCPTVAATTAPQSASNVFSTTQHITAPRDAHDSPNATTTVRGRTSSPVSAQSRGNDAVSNSSLSPVLSVDGGTTALTDAAVRDTSTTAGLMSSDQTRPHSLLTRMISAASHRDRTSVAARTAAEARSVTEPVSTALRRDTGKHERTTAGHGGSSVEESSVTETSAASVADSATSAGQQHHTTDQPGRQTDVERPATFTSRRPVAVQSTSPAHDHRQSDSFDDTRDAGVTGSSAAPATTTTGDRRTNVSVTSPTDVISATAADNVSRSRDSAAVTSHDRAASDIIVNSRLRVTATSDGVVEGPRRGAHTTSTTTSASASSQHVSLERPRSLSTRLTSSSDNISVANSGEVDLTASTPAVTESSVNVSAVTRQLSDGDSSSSAASGARITQSTARRGPVATITRRALNSHPHTAVTRIHLPLSSSEHTTESRHHSSFHGSLLSSSGDGSSTESVSVPSSGRVWSAVSVTSTARRLDMIRSTRRSSSSSLSTADTAVGSSADSQTTGEQTVSQSSTRSSPLVMSQSSTRSSPLVTRPTFHKSTVVQPSRASHAGVMTSLLTSPLRAPASTSSRATTASGWSSTTSVRLASQFTAPSVDSSDDDHTRQMSASRTGASSMTDDFTRAPSALNSSSDNATHRHTATWSLAITTTSGSLLPRVATSTLTLAAATTTGSLPPRTTSTQPAATSAAATTTTSPTVRESSWTQRTERTRPTHTEKSRQEPGIRARGL